MPKSLLVVKRTEINKARYPAINFHFHGRTLQAPDDYRQMIAVMDEAGLGAVINMDGGLYEVMDRNLQVGEACRDRIVHFARPVWEGHQ